MAEMRKNVVADTSFYICHACNLKRIDHLENLLQSFQFHYGPIINEEIPHLGKHDDRLRKQITPHATNYAVLFKPFSKRGKHLEEDGEYEAIGIAVELSMTGELDYLIIDDNGPKNFAKNKIARIYPTLSTEKIVGTVGFIRDCHKKESLLTKDECISRLKSMYDTHLLYKKEGRTQRPCSLDDKFVEETLLPLIKELED